MAIDYSYPSWLVPRTEPWQALVAGVSAGAQIAANNQRGRALTMQAQQQAFHDSLLQAKADADTADMAALRDWWPQFTNATPDTLKTLQAPPLKNAEMWNHVTMEVEKKKQQAAASEFANTLSTADASTPEGQAAIWGAARKTGQVDLNAIDQIINRAVTAKQKEADARSLSEYRQGQLEKTPQVVNEAKADEFQQISDALKSVNPSLSEYYQKRSDDMRNTLRANVTQPVTTATAGQIQQRMLTADKTLELGSELLNKLSASDVGVRGNINQVLINQGLAQLFPSMSVNSVTEARTLLGQFNEQAVKAFAADPRISNKDMERYKQILPSLGNVESLESAKQKIRTFMQKFQDQTRIDAKAAGKPIPDWALSVDELKAKIASGDMTEDQAVEILKRYHPNP